MSLNTSYEQSLTSKGDKICKIPPLPCYCGSTVGDLQGASLTEKELLITSQP